MRDFSVIIAIISLAGAVPLPSALDDLFGDTSYDAFLDSGSSDLYTSTVDDQPLLLAGSISPNTVYDPAWDDVPWSVGGGDSSWTGVNRPTLQPNGDYLSPEDRIRAEHTGEDFEAGYGTLPPTVNPNGGPTSFELSPEQAAAVVTAGTLVINSVTYVYDKIKGVINVLGDWIPSGSGL